MKKIGLLTTILLAALTVNAQRLPAGQAGTPADPMPAAESDRMVSETAQVIEQVRRQVQSRVEQDKSRSSSTITEAEYQLLVTRADGRMLSHNYNEAETLYNEILEHRFDQYSKDKIAEIQALKAKQQREFEAAKKDAALRAKAEEAKGKFYAKRQVHLTGGVMSDEFRNNGISKAFTDDIYSNFLSVGKYDTLSKFLTKANTQTLDGLAIPANVRVVVYKDVNFNGEVLLDITGPAIVNNMLWTDHQTYSTVNTKNYSPELQDFYPQAVRFWSLSNMHYWPKGSMEILWVNE
jgi:hypothetical protein